MFRLRAVTAVRLSLLAVLLVSLGVSVDGDDHTVEKWADRIGRDIWDLANAIIQPDGIKNEYIRLNARVEDKSGEELIEIISGSVGRMLRQKMDAVRRISECAERAAELFNYTSISNWTEITRDSAKAQDLPYFSGKYSPVVNRPHPQLPKSASNNSYMYKEMELIPDPHFYNIPVNTSYSSVHVPTNVHDLARDVNQAIQWSKELDDVFTANYKADPALSWQYFGSSTGILRQFPAMEWRVGEAPDRYDCRMRSWFIESATCSKHMVILLDISGSMLGMSYTIARATAGEILDTLSNNDFVTIIGYSNVTIDAVECFKGTLVQATPENIGIFKKSMHKMPVTDPTDLNLALGRAFDVLEDFRELFCGAETPCTQAIMLITDGVPGNLTQVYESRNRLRNGTHIPVRVFTYLLGRDVTNVREIQWMACKNRGYYSHIHDLAEVREQVLKYIPVIARPLVLQKDDHPLIWTHAYADISNPALATWLRLVMEQAEEQSRLIKYLKAKEQGARMNEDSVYITKKVENESDNEDGSSAPKKTEYQTFKLLTSVSMPAYDRKTNNQNRTRIANLLGVAGTDVPLHEINRLTLPYKLGVNGYAFIVSNNGYVILHPALKPASRGRLKVNYNSVDLTEVENIDDDRGPRNPGQLIKDLRWALVNHNKSNNIKGIPVKFHYDDYRRVTLEKRDYFYAPLQNTPFGLAIALPEYGTHWIKVTDVIEKNRKKDVKIADFFDGDRWRVHPDWVYCRFHYLEGHVFETHEDEIRHFAKALNTPEWHWAEQYAELPDEPSGRPTNSSGEDGGEEKYEYADRDENETEGLSTNYRKPACSRRKLGKDDYYCNAELMQLLVFDAELTSGSFTKKFEYSTPIDEELGEAYGVFLRFIATQSGLTRWQDVGERSKEPTPTTESPTQEYEDYDEDAKPADLEFGDLYSRAVNEPWYKGAIFQHNVDNESISLTVPSTAGPNAIVTVAQGIFPRDGSKEAPAAVVGFQMPMQSFYKRFLDVTSTSTESDLSCANDWIDCYLIDQNGYVVITNKYSYTGMFFGIVEGAIMESLVRQKVYESVELYNYQALCSTPIITGASGFFKNPIHHLTQLLAWFFARMIWLTSQFIDLPETWGRKSAGEDAPDPPPDPKLEQFDYACDEKRTLYILQKGIEKFRLGNIPEVYSRPFHAEKVRYTNLLLIVVNTMYPSGYFRREVDPTEILPSSYPNGGLGFPCHKLELTRYPRRALEGCYTEHPLEEEIEDCGAGASIPRSALFFVGFVVCLTLFESSATICR